MRSKFCAVIASIEMIVAMSLAAGVMVRAQAPAGPNRPPQVPEEYVVTPFGYFHPSCVVHLAKGEELLEGGRVIQKADRTFYTVPVCEYPHYTARGQMFALEPPTIGHSWILSGDTTTSTSYGEIDTNWYVPAAPQSYDGQTIYFFPGLEDINDIVTILQPVLGWNSDFTKAWGIASWNCCPSGTADESPAVRVNTGDIIVSTVESTCSSGALSCPTWTVATEDATTGRSTTLNNTPSEGQTFNWAFAGVLEVYNVVQCSDYPADHYLAFYATLFDQNFNVVRNPSWSITDWSSGLTPQCQYGGQVSPGEVILDFGGLNLTVAPIGNGSVASTDGYINCPGTCSHTYPSGTRITLNAYTADGWVFGGWNGGCAGTGSCSLVFTQPLTVDAIFSQALQFVPTAPCRLVDTRKPTGTFGGPSIRGGVPRSFPIPQQTPCDIPATAEAYSLNVTLVPTGGQSVGFLTLWPTGENQPNVSIMNSWDGRFKANAAIVPAGANGAVSVYSSDTTDVVLDIDGYFVPASGSTLAFYPLPPCRVADTRHTNGPLGGPYLRKNTERDFPVLQATACNIPSTAQAYSLNFTVIPRSDQVWVFTAWPFGQNQPGTSTLNAPTGTVVANAAILPAGSNGKIATSASADTDLAIDINGYFAPAGAGGLSLYPVAPCRVLDTRKVGNGDPFTGILHPPADPVTSICGVPSTSEAYVFNATIVPANNPVYLLTLWPDGGQLPNVSTLNAYDSAVTSNMAIVPTTNGSIDADTAGLTQLVLDISGYFAQ